MTMLGDAADAPRSTTSSSAAATTRSTRAVMPLELERAAISNGRWSHDQVCKAQFVK